MSYRVGVDFGSTLTDLLLLEPSTGAFWRHKTPSTLHDSSVGILNGVEVICAKAKIMPEDVEIFLHGITVATNALLEGEGARLSLVVNEGYRQVMQIARGFVPRRLDRLAEARTAGETRRHYRRCTKDRIDGSRTRHHRHCQRKHFWCLANNFREAGLRSARFRFDGFGGAGPIHVNAIARPMGSWPALSPVSPGVVCAWGDATTQMHTETTRSFSLLARDTKTIDLTKILGEMATQTRESLIADGLDKSDITVFFEMDVRYADDRIQTFLLAHRI